MATIYDVSKAAGVSIATVSRVYNGSRRVDEKTRRLVVAAAEALDYHPNALARSLVHKSTETVALVVPDISNPFFPEVARGVEDAANGSGYNVILCNSDNRPEKEVAYCSVMRKRRVDGIIFIMTGEETSHIAALNRAGVPVVLVDREPGDLPIDMVVTDNLEGGRAAAQHLLDLGHERLGTITGPLKTRTAADRLLGFQQVLEAAGRFRLEYVTEGGGYDMPSGYLGMNRLLALPEPPTAVFAGNDLMAIGALRALEEAGMTAPRDVSVVGYDDIALASITSPRLTTVAQPKYEMGYTAMEVLMRRLTESGSDPQRVVLRPQLVIRGSAAQPKGKDAVAR